MSNGMRSCAQGAGEFEPTNVKKNNPRTCLRAFARASHLYCLASLAFISLTTHAAPWNYQYIGLANFSGNGELGYINCIGGETGGSVSEVVSKMMSDSAAASTAMPSFCAEVVSGTSSGTIFSWGGYQFLVQVDVKLCSRGGVFCNTGTSPALIALTNGRNPKNLGDSSCSLLSGNPINNGYGNKVQRESDYQSPVIKDFQFLRIYNSAALDSSGVTGTLWRHYFLRSLGFSTTTAANIAVNRNDGRVFSFNRINGTWVSDADISDTLVQLTDTSGNPTGWRYTVAADDSVETYGVTGKLLTIADRAGHTQTLTYTDGTSGPNGGYVLDASGNPTATVLSAGLLLRVTVASGSALNFGYDASSRIVQLTDPSGGIIAYGYDTNSNLASVTYPDGKIKTYQYENATFPHALTGIVDENGDRFATYRYDSQGRADDEDHGGTVDHYNLAYTTDASGNPISTTVTDPIGTARTHNFTTILGVVKSTGVSQPGGSGCGAASSAITYDANGNIASRADFNGHKTCYAYDLTRNLETARVEGLASSSSCPSDPATYTPAANSAERKILTQWDTRFRLPTKVTEAGRETTTVYDSHGNVTSRSIKDTATGQTRAWTTSYTYHASVPGVLVQTVEDGPRIDVADLTTTDYYAPDESCTGDPLGCRGQVKQITNALGHITTVNEYDANGRVLRTTDPNGLVTTFSYSPRGWLTSRSVGSETTSFDYDGVGQLIKFTRPDGSYTAYTYDAAHRLTSIVDSLGNKIAYTLDTAGNRTKEDVHDPSGRLAQTQRREYDALNRLWKEIGAQGQTTTYQYDAQGNRKQTANPLNHATVSQYDPLDRLVRTLDPAGGQTTQTPDALDHITSVTDPKGVTTTYTYNAFGEVVREVSADRGTTNYTYNDAGALVSRKDARGVTFYYGRDILNRLTGIRAVVGDIIRVDRDNSRLFYDEGANALGRLTSIKHYIGGNMYSYVQGDERYRYDTYGRLLHKEESVDGGLALDLAYDPAGRPHQATYPSGTVVTTTYGLDSRPVELRVNGQILMSDIVYQPFGAPKAWTWGNGQPYTRSFDTDGRASQYLLGSDTRIITYDDASRIVHTDHVTPGLNRDYGYDVLDRLIRETDNIGPSRWTYDANGNRTSSQPGTASYAYGYAATSNHLLSVTGPDPKIYTYDAAGNMIGDGVYTYGYDKFGRLATVNQGSIRKASYRVNALGQRTSKTVDGVTTLFFYDEAGRLLGEYDGSRALIQETVWLGDLPVAVLKKSPTGQTEVYRIHADHLNTPRAILDNANRVVWKWHSNAFGQGQPEEDPDGDGTLFVYNLRFPGQYFDKETLRHYNYFRDYDPSTGRYIEADPIGLEAGMNLYAYANGNPVSRKDPKGLDSFDDLYQYIQQPGFDPDRPPESRPGDTITLCRLRCAVDFYNPIPDTVTEKASEKVLGEVATEFLKKFNKGKSAYDLGNCLHTCQQQFKSCTK